MNSLILPSSLLRLRLRHRLYPSPPPQPTNQLRPRWRCRGPLSRVRCSSSASEEGQIPLMSMEAERDWSFLEGAAEAERAIMAAAGGIGEGQRVMAWGPSEGFVDGVVGFGPELVVVLHDSLMALAGIKERHDSVRCWHVESAELPGDWAGLSFDVVFLYFLPALPFSLHHLLHAVANCCLPGSKLVISHPQGRQALEQQSKDFPGVVVSDLPHKSDLLNVAADHSFHLLHFSDDPSFYLAVLKYQPAD